MKRQEGVLSWDEMFMSIAMVAAGRSKDPSTQVGACIASPDNKIYGVGYNGFPRGCSDDDFPWEREGEALGTKYFYVVHAEENAILNSVSRDLTGCRLYVALFPCNECAKIIIQSGIKEVIYLSDKYHNLDITVAARWMFEAAGVKTRLFVSDNPLLKIS